MDLEREAFLGDSIYAREEGGAILLTLGDQRNPALIALGPQAFKALILFARMHRYLPP